MENTCYNTTMKLKKWYMPIVLGLAMSLSACQGVTVKRTGIKDGTYAVKVAGYRGDIELEVLFEKQNLKKIKVISHSETDVLTNEAFDKIPKRMIESQSLNVDLSTGATNTSKAIQEGVKQAILQAGGLEKEWMVDRKSKNVPKPEQKETKVVVVGAGVSGIAATLRLRQLGIPAVLVEKAKEVGGSMAYASNAYQYVSGTHLDQQEKKLSNAELASKLQKLGKGNLEMIQDFQSLLQETLDWQSEDLGMTFEEKYIADDKDRRLSSVKYEKKKKELLSLLRREIGVSRADVYTDAALVDYLKEGHKVIGVRIKKANGKLIDIKAKAVVLAMGSQLRNTDGLTPVDATRVYGGPSQNQGDGFLLAKQEKYEVVVSLPSSMLQAGASNLKQAVSVEEVLRELKKDEFALSDSKGNLLSPESYEKNGLLPWIKKLDYKIGYLWLTKSGYDKLRDEIIKTHSLSEQYVKEMKEKDSLVISSGDSVSLVAKKANIALPKGIKLTGQLYCICLEPYRIQSLSGLKVNREFHVMNGKKAVPNVYAIGSLVGGVFGNYESLGVSNAFSFVSGKAVAEKLAKELEGK